MSDFLKDFLFGDWWENITSDVLTETAVFKPIGESLGAEDVVDDVSFLFVVHCGNILQSPLSFVKWLSENNSA